MITSLLRVLCRQLRVALPFLALLALSLVIVLTMLTYPSTVNALRSFQSPPTSPVGAEPTGPALPTPTPVPPPGGSASVLWIVVGLIVIGGLVIVGLVVFRRR